MNSQNSRFAPKSGSEGVFRCVLVAELDARKPTCNCIPRGHQVRHTDFVGWNSAQREKLGGSHAEASGSGDDDALFLDLHAPPLDDAVQEVVAGLLKESPIVSAYFVRCLIEDKGDRQIKTAV